LKRHLAALCTEHDKNTMLRTTIGLLAYGLAAAIILSGLCAIVLWLLTDTSSNIRCSSDREGLLTEVSHIDGTGHSTVRLSYESRVLTKQLAPTATMEIGSTFIDSGQPTKWSGSSRLTVEAFQVAPGVVQYAEFSAVGENFYKLNRDRFPFDRQVLYLHSKADINMADGGNISLPGPDNVCLRTSSLFTPESPMQIAGERETYLLAVTRQNWFIALTLCATFLAWVPLMVAVKTGNPHGSLELLATITYIAAIRAFLTADLSPVTLLGIDVAIFPPLLVLAVLQLVRPRVPR